MTPSFSLWLRTTGLFLLIATVLLPQTARASHAMGADLYYTNVGPNIYLVTYRLFRDCSGISGDPMYTLNYTGLNCAPNNGTNPGSSISLIKQSITDGNPYCSRVLSSQQPCDSSISVSTPFSNFQIWTYQGVLSLNGSCSIWKLSVTISARSTLANITNSGDLYAETILNNRDVTEDSSPFFSVADRLMPLIAMCDSSTIHYQINASDPDGDSLVFSFVPAMEAPTTACVYSTGYTATSPIRILPGTPMTLSPDGLLSLQVGTNSSNTANDNAENKFVVVFQIDAYRNVNGQIIQSGRVRREMVAIIVPCVGQPIAPTIQPGNIEVRVPGQPTRYLNPGDVVLALPNELLQIRVSGQDVNGDSLRAYIDNSSMPIGATVNIPPGALSNAPFMYFFWTPNTAQISPQPYVLRFRVKDNGCPIPASTDYTLPIQVVSQLPNGLNVVKETEPLPAAPNPFTTEVRLSIKVHRVNAASEVVIYDVAGRMVDRLPVAAGAGGERPLIWRPRPDLKSGLYLARYSDGTSTQTVRLQKL